MSFSSLKTHHSYHRGSTMLSLMLVASLMFLVTGCAFPGMGNQTELRGRLTVAGSTALEPLLKAVVPLFEQAHPQVQIEVQSRSSLTNLDALVSQQVDIGAADLYADLAHYPDPRLTDHIVAVVPFTLIAAPDVMVTSLTRQQLIAIFSTGNIRNWKQVGGQDRPIVPVVRTPNSGTRSAFRKYVLGGYDEIRHSTGTLVQKDSSVAVRETVARTPGAIGYLALPLLSSSVRSLAIEGKTATTNNIETEAYSFWAYEHMYTLGEGNALVQAFLKFMTAETVQRHAKQLRYIPLAEITLPNGLLLDATNTRQPSS